MNNTFGVLVNGTWVLSELEVIKKDNQVFLFVKNGNDDSIKELAIQNLEILIDSDQLVISGESTSIFIALSQYTDELIETIESLLYAEGHQFDHQWEDVDDYPALFKFEEELANPKLEQFHEYEVSSESDDFMKVDTRRNYEENDTSYISQSLPIAIPKKLMDWNFESSDDDEANAKPHEIAAKTYQEYYIDGDVRSLHQIQ